MAKVEVVMPQMGESVMEGTVIEWSKTVGDRIEVDETLLEIDKYREKKGLPPVKRK